MLLVGIPLFILVTLLPGLLAVRLLRNDKSSSSLGILLYAVGLGLLFNLLVGAIANFLSGMNLWSVVGIYVALLSILSFLSWQFGKHLSLKWLGLKPLIIPIGLYLLGVALQLQTTLMSPNLVGSDIHLEYFISNMTLEQGFWNPMFMGTTLNASLGLTLLLPVYKLLTGLELLWVFKVISPLVFAILPLVLYRIFKMQFGTVVSVLAVVFFVTMPMFTMDLVQLVRQQQSELFFVLVVLLLLDDNLNALQKMILGTIFGAGAIVTHVGIAIGFIGYLLSGAIVAVVLAKLWKRKVDDAKKPMLARFALVGLAVISIGIYAGYYGWVNNGWMIKSPTIPITIVTNTAKQVMGNVDKVRESEKVSVNTSDGMTEEMATGSVRDKEGNGLVAEEVLTAVGTDVPMVGSVVPAFFQRLPFLDPFTKEPLAQTAIGLDFGKASALGKVWRVLQYLVEICLVIGFFRLLLRPLRTIKIEYMAFVIASFFVLVGMYVLTNYGWGLGAVRVWQITLLFMSPLFVIGCGTIGKWLTRFWKISEGKLVACSTLILLVPYFIFNSGVVFELAKLEPRGFIDVPYSIALSGHRVDIASIFTEQDVEAMDWLKGQFLSENESNYKMIYTDTHGGNLLVQRIGSYIKEGEFKYLWQMLESDTGYIFLRKWSVDNNKLTIYGDYGSRQSYSIDDYDVLKSKIENGAVVFDNGAKIILVK